MVKLAANLSMMFNEFEFLDRFSKASESGFKGVEYLFPYDYGKDHLVNLLVKMDLCKFFIIYLLEIGTVGREV